MEKPTETTDTVELGGNIQLSGFSELDQSELIVVKKVIGTYCRKLTDKHDNFRELRVLLKILHKREKSEKYEITAKLLLDGNWTTAQEIDRNLFFCLDSTLKKLENASDRK